MRRALVLITLLGLSLAACSSSSKPAATTTTTGAPSTTAAPTTTAPTATTAAPVTSAPSSIVTDGRQSAYIDSVDLTAHTITIDPMQYLTGPAAVAAFKKANPSAVEGPPNDYYIVNPTKDHLVVPLPTSAKVELVIINGVPHTTPVAVPQAKLATYAQLTRAPFWITVANGKVTLVMEQFVP